MHTRHTQIRQTAYIGIGTNLGCAYQQLNHTLHALATLHSTRVLAVSTWYRNPATGFSTQPPFINGAAALKTTLPPFTLLQALQAIERSLGRVQKRKHWGPRTIDLDLLFYGQHAMNTARLTLPHPEIANRAFVIKPLHEILSSHHPAYGKIQQWHDTHNAAHSYEDLQAIAFKTRWQKIKP